MKKHRAVFLLRLSFLLGAVIAAAAVVPMVSTQSAYLLWGFAVFTSLSRFAMHLCAALMSGWALLLLWAFFKPLERRMAAPLTMLIVVGFLIAELIAVQNGALTLGKALIPMVIQVLILIVFTLGYMVTRHKSMRS